MIKVLRILFQIESYTWNAPVYFFVSAKFGLNLNGRFSIHVSMTIANMGKLPVLMIL